jgi:hypothetical protein
MTAIDEALALPPGQRWVAFDPFDGMALAAKEGVAVIVGVDTLPFWLKRGLVHHIRATGNVVNVWTMGEPTTSEWETRTEAYLLERFPKAHEILFDTSQAEADAFTRELLELAALL